MGVTLQEPLEIEQKIIAIENPNSLFKVGATIPVEIEVKTSRTRPTDRIENGKFFQKNGRNPKKLERNGESGKDVGETSDSEDSSSEKEKVRELMSDVEELAKSEDGENSSTNEEDDKNDEFAEKVLVTRQGFGVTLYNASLWTPATELAYSASVHLGCTSKVFNKGWQVPSNAKLLQKKESKFLRELLDTSKTPTPREFVRRFREYVTNRDRKDFQYFLEEKPNMTFWVPEVIRYFIQKDMLSNSVVKGGIVKALIDREEWNMLKLALLYVPDIPERDLIYLLKFIIGKGGVIKENVTSSRIVEKENLSIENALLLVIHAPRNDNMMRWNIKQLTENELSVILRILYEWSEKHNLTEIMADFMSEKPDVDVEIFEKSSKRSPIIKLKKLKKTMEFRNIVDFLTLILDIHFSSFIMNHQLHPLLNKLSERIAYEVKFFESLESMRSCLKLYHNKHLRNEHLINEDEYRKKSNVLARGADLPEYTVELFTFFGDNNGEISNLRIEEIGRTDESIIRNGVSISSSAHVINGGVYHGDMDVDAAIDDERVEFENGQVSKVVHGSNGIEHESD
ncbi:10866_t:CDS:2 [Acaulospora colombiana]|uniref:10866_t:CDS:1 n=1 Tax=Acaulospora colombiana TaxID=27376 RepID=A0ACA9KK04_9GLOM|nr:10866_t:CDS:2 [Acaulospora colombiana]